MSTKRSRNVLSEAVRQLRQVVGESQMAFAKRMDWHIVTLARYETNRPPKGRALAQLWQLAYDQGKQDLARVFLGGFQTEIGKMVFAAPKGFEAAVDGFIYVLGNPKLQKKQQKLLKLLEPEIELMEATHAVARLSKEQMKILRAERARKKS